MRFEVRALPRVECALVGSKRSGAPYNAAKEELAGEVYAAAPRRATPFLDPLVSIVAFVGEGGDGYFRPRTPMSLWPALDGLFEGLKRAGLVESVSTVMTKVTRVQTREEEGLLIVLSELEVA